MINLLKGLGVSAGYGVGTAYVYKQHDLVINRNCIEPNETTKEFERFLSAKEAVSKETKKVKEYAAEVMSEDEAEVFKAHLMILEDPQLENEVKGNIENKNLRAEYSLELTMNKYIKLLNECKNSLMQERALDIKDVCTRILHILTETQHIDLNNLENNTIIIASDLTPSEIMQLDVSKVVGIVLEVGGKTSHTSIFARSLEIPTVVGVPFACEHINNGDMLRIDGCKGKVWLNMTEEEIKIFNYDLEKFRIQMSIIERFYDAESITKDSRKIDICANIGSYSDCKLGIKYGLDGIGLFRTEFLYMEKSNWPSEDVQFNEYKKVVELMGNRSVIIRTLDIGGDKELPYFDFDDELNPFLGWRAIRMCLDNIDIFKTQLKAILRASNFGRVRIMYPMVSSIEEIIKANDVLNEARSELRIQKIAFDDEIEVGIMVETPAAAILADQMVKYVDFFSIGTNDLTQYTLAVDRGNEKISNLYQSHHPAVLRLIKNVVDASHKAGKWTGMCGELAGLEEFTEVLVGIGLDELSMPASSVPIIRKNLTNIYYTDAKKTAEKVLQMETANQVMDFVRKKMGD